MLLAQEDNLTSRRGCRLVILGISGNPGQCADSTEYPIR
jgi:hypothetical protein